MRKILKIYNVLIFLILLFSSCEKKWLEAKPDKSLITPNTINDFQQLLDNSDLFNMTQACGLGEIGAGDFYISFSVWKDLFNIQEKSAYTWASTADFYGKEQSIDWVNGFRRILNANVILEGIEKIQPEFAEKQDWNNVKGNALFLRAFNFFYLAQEYCGTYQEISANTDLGLPLRLEYDVNVKVKRSSLQQTYDRIIADLELAKSLLNTQPKYKTRPSKEAVYALLARVYLIMGKYAEAGRNADLALKIQPELIDYSKLNSSAAFPITRFNEEVIFHCVFSYGIFNPSRLIVEPALFDDYELDDCRRSIFFTTGSTGMTFKGSYNGDRTLFCGLSTGEMYLIRSEANARNGALALALADLNRLRFNRWKAGYNDLVSANSKVVLDHILKERRKELIFRGIRWTDLRRLNKDSRYAVTLTRILNGNTYTLQPNDKRYVLPIDDEEIRLSGLEQNER